MNEQILEAALELTARNMAIVLCGGDDGKNPNVSGDGWQNRKWTEQDIERELTRHPSRTLGLIMGPRSGVIDLECDSPEAESTLLDLFDREMPVTPTWKSKRGKHWLFKYDDRLEDIGKGHFAIGKLDVKLGCGGRGTQCNAPPSTAEGVMREWLPGLSLDDVDPATIPDAVVKKLALYGVNGYDGLVSLADAVAGGVAEGGRNNGAAAHIGKLAGAAQRLDDDAIWQRAREWNETNDPPMAEAELRKTFDSIVGRERSGRAREVSERAAAITNATIEEKKALPLPMADILGAIRKRSGDWPRRVDDRLFVYDAAGIHWLGSAPALFGWLATIGGRTFWHRAVGCVSKDELFQELRRTSRRYMSVADMPHEPAANGHFYACDIPEPGDGEALGELLDRYEPATDIDGDLMKAALMTLAWGGPPGTRPCFVITSDDGRGVGKTVFAETASQVFGGAISFSHKEDIGKIKTRLLSPDALTKRAAMLDNVKTLKFSWDDLESLITSTSIGGHRMYAGEATRPNMLTWFVTLNGPSLSTDMSQRAVIVKVKRPVRSGAWHEEIVQFIEKNRQRIIADLIACLRVEPVKLQSFTRWATWERYVLARLPEPSDAQAVIRERQGLVDADAEEADILEVYFAEQLKRLAYNPLEEHVFIPSQIAARWSNWAHNENHKVAAVSRVISQLSSEGRIKRLKPNTCKTWGRGFVWSGFHAEIDATTLLDIQERLAKKANEKLDSYGA